MVLKNRFDTSAKLAFLLSGFPPKLTLLNVIRCIFKVVGLTKIFHSVWGMKETELATNIRELWASIVLSITCKRRNLLNTLFKQTMFKKNLNSICSIEFYAFVIYSQILQKQCYPVQFGPFLSWCARLRSMKGLLVMY